MSCEQAPSFLGAYVLGALDPAERRSAEEHLARCPACAAELAEFRGLTAQLDRLPADEVGADPVTASPELFARVASAARRPRRRWSAVAAAAAAAVVAGLTWTATGGEEEVRTAAEGPLRMSVEASPRADGTALDVTVAGLPPHQECRLVVVDDRGAEHAEGEWTAYGQQVSYRLVSEVPPDDLADVVLRDPDGGELVRVRFGD